MHVEDTNLAAVDHGGSSAEEIRQQLQQILLSAPFRNSQRYRNFLRYVVERTLDGHAKDLKERVVGVDVFGRNPDYDTTADPVVRVTAGEVRKRISQHYDSPEHGGDVRISLPPGAYVPEFRSGKGPFPKNVAAGVSEPADNLDSDKFKPIAETVQLSFLQQAVHSRWLLLLPLLTLTIAAFWLGRYFPSNPERPTSVSKFWDSVCRSSGSILISVGELGVGYDARQQVDPPIDATHPLPEGRSIAPNIYELLSRNTVSWADSITASRLAGFVEAKGNTFSILRSRSTSLNEIRNSATILVGGFNNKWIMRLLPSMRFDYKREGNVHRIRDREHPEQMDWKVDFSHSPSEFTQDYGIIARFWDPVAERPIVVASGIAAFGTMTASEFLTSPRYLDELARKAPPHWEKKNLEAVFVTSIIDGETGPPKILATQFW